MIEYFEFTKDQWEEFEELLNRPPKDLDKVKALLKDVKTIEYEMVIRIPKLY